MYCCEVLKGKGCVVGRLVWESTCCAKVVHSRHFETPVRTLRLDTTRPTATLRKNLCTIIQQQNLFELYLLEEQLACSGVFFRPLPTALLLNGSSSAQVGQLQCKWQSLATAGHSCSMSLPGRNSLSFP